ncbi:hypothetical protein [Natronomonas sp.]|uniref:hypothetical protein n=1 Tax=Natronomonas sp. TaxID=2184060 RepID=UPI002FC34E2B
MTEASSVSWVRSRHGLLAGSALLDILTRLPEDILTPALSIVSGWVGNPSVSFVTTWLMLAVAFYTFAPLAYSHLDVLPREATGFRAIFAGGTVSLGVFLEQATTPEVLVAGTFLVLLGCAGLFLTYFDRRHGWSLLDPEGKSVAIVDFVAPHEDVTDEIEADLEREGWLGGVGAGLHLLAVGMLVGLPVAIAAISTRALVYAYPIPDVAFLAWAVSVRVLPRTDAGPDQRRVLDLEFDFERFLADVIENATRSLQGMFMTVFTVLGVFLSAGFVFVGISLTTAILDLLVTGLSGFVQVPTIDVGLILWNAVGVLFLLGLAGIYGLWAWVRELRRLPYFLNAWESRETDHAGALVSRPPGLIAVPVTAWLLAVAYVHYADISVFRAAFAVSWPPGIVAIFWTVRWTLHRAPQPIGSESWWIVAALVVQTWSVWLSTSLPDVVDAFTRRGGLGEVIALPLSLTVLLLLGTSVPEIQRYETQHEGLRRYLFVGLLFLMGVLAFVSRGRVPARFEFIALILGVLGFGAGLLLGLVRYYRL